MARTDFDYTPRMIAAQRDRPSYLKEPEYLPSWLEDPEKQWRSEWPSMGEEKWCSSCVHWVKKNCEAEEDYCLSHGRCYWRHKRSAPKPKPFLTEEDFKL